MGIRIPESERSPQKKIEDAAYKIVETFHATLIRSELRMVDCEDEELNIMELYVTGVQLATVIEMNLAMAKDLAKTNDKMNIIPLFVLEN